MKTFVQKELLLGPPKAVMLVAPLLLAGAIVMAMASIGCRWAAGLDVPWELYIKMVFLLSLGLTLTAQVRRFPRSLEIALAVLVVISAMVVMATSITDVCVLLNTR